MIPNGVVLWVAPNGTTMMNRLGYKSVSYLTWLIDEEGDRVNGYSMPEADALAAIELITEYNALPCNDCCHIKAYIK
jgi:hypothetical protein